MSIRDGVLRCDWRPECTDAVTHIGEKGYAYCAGHVANRHGVERTRKLLVRERKALERGEKLPSFERARGPTRVEKEALNNKESNGL